MYEIHCKLRDKRGMKDAVSYGTAQEETLAVIFVPFFRTFKQDLHKIYTREGDEMAKKYTLDKSGYYKTTVWDGTYRDGNRTVPIPDKIWPFVAEYVASLRQKGKIYLFTMQK